MVDPATTRLWSYRALYLALAALIMFLHLIPLQTQASRWAAPDFLICLTFAWLLRRPDYVPVLSIVAVFVIADVFFLRPLGLMAALVVLGSEFLRSRTSQMRELSFVLEWASVAIVIAAILFANRIVLLIVVVEPPVLSLTGMQFGATVLAYPLVVLASHLGLGVQRLQPGEVQRPKVRP